MLELSIVGIALQGENSSPSLLLHPFGADKIFFMPLAPSDAFTLSSTLHGPLEGRDEPRRDLPARLLHALGGRLLYVELMGFGTTAMQAVAVLLAGASTLRLRCRPAEGVMLSIQCGAPLRTDAEALSAAKSLDDPGLELSAHVRTLVRTAMLRDKLDEAPAADTEFDFSRIPLVLEGKVGRSERTAEPARAPRLRVSVRQTGPGVPQATAQVVDAQNVAAQSIAAQSAPDNAGPETQIPLLEEDRWATLLQVLAPETKTLM